MTVHRAWRHFTATANSAGLASASSDGVPGDVVVAGGGYGELVLADSSNTSSTNTDGDSASGYCPIAAIFTEYDSVSDTTSLLLKVAAQPYSKVRVHVFTTWES